MKHSEQINDVAAGLAKFRQAFKAPGKNGKVKMTLKTGRSMNYDYMTLDDAIAAIDKALKDTGITYIQNSKTEGTKIGVTTLIMSDTGQWIETDPIEILTSADPKQVGAGQTYARRYSLAAAFAIATEPDNDISTLEDAPKKTANTAPKATATKQPAAPAKAHKKPETDAEKNDAINKTVAAINDMGFTFEERLGETLDETLDRAVKQFRLAKSATMGPQ
jgi:hypothetical protein